jgi:hypothetical protein
MYGPALDSRQDMARTNIAVEQAVADDLSLEAGRANKTLYALANESPLAVLEVVKAGGAPKRIPASWRFVSMMKDMDCIGLPGDLVEKIVARMYASDNEWLLRTWFEQGSRLGSYLRMFAKSPEELGGVIEQFQVLISVMPLHKIEFRKVSEGEYVMRAVGSGSRESSPGLRGAAPPRRALRVRPARRGREDLRRDDRGRGHGGAPTRDVTSAHY